MMIGYVGNYLGILVGDRVCIKWNNFSILPFFKKEGLDANSIRRFEFQEFDSDNDVSWTGCSVADNYNYKIGNKKDSVFNKSSFLRGCLQVRHSLVLPSSQHLEGV